MKNKSIFFFFFLATFSCLFFESYAQEALKPRLSPLEVVTMKYEDAYVKITYGRPHKRGRDVFGTELAPYGAIWRTGANEATEITVTKDIKIAGKKLKAGTYTLFTIPYQDKWTVILNEELGQWGAYNYNAEKDILRFDVPVQKTETIYEPFTVEFEQNHTTTNIIMMWDNVRVSITIEFI
ncbi:MAG: DUF2911 domain-containing protein [Bacteroidota bacterium]|nr:DUF2911 domain-containing protein [Bacteroidota bacterium]